MNLGRCLLVSSLSLVLPLAGCTGFHSLPPPDYADLPDDGVLRLVFDERGDPWPLAHDAAAAAEAVIPGDLDKSRSFRLARRLEASGAPYDRAAILDAAAARLGKGGGRVVVLINGFNNSYGSFRSKYAGVRQWLAAQGAPADTRYVEVYWDALHRAGGKVAYPVALFPRARGNAERAGACGLRDLLVRLPAGTEVTLVAHSLGSQVALSTVADPPPGRDSIVCDGRPVPATPASQLGDLRLTAFAPALGAGQLEDSTGEFPATLLARVSRFVIAWDPNDPVITKRRYGVNLPDTLGGDTRLGGNEAFVRAVEDKAGAAGAERFQPLRFEQKSHELTRYLADIPRAACVLWAGKVLPERPAGCTLMR
ncbi:MAG: hypothetical protein KGL44_04685 [Sphingomonadales bacterium]|nr:hypothetical protein [Sphingomonadales bacterium]